jgi:hypothetical protein
VVHAPDAPAGQRLVRDPRSAGSMGPDEEIRLTYRELTALIEDAVRHLK